MPSTASFFFRMMSLQGKVALSQLGIARVFEASKSKVCQSCRYSDLNRTSSAQTLPCTGLFFSHWQLQYFRWITCALVTKGQCHQFLLIIDAREQWFPGPGVVLAVNIMWVAATRRFSGCSVWLEVVSKNIYPWNEHKTHFWGCHCNLLTSFFSSGC